MNSRVRLEMRALEKGASTAFEEAGKGANPCMHPAVCLQFAFHGKGAAAVRVRAGKGFLSGMNPRVRQPGGALGKGALAARVRAGKGPLSGMNPRVRLECLEQGKGASTAFKRADKGPISGMRPFVHPQVGRLGKAASTVGIRADAGFLSCMNPVVYAQEFAPCEGLAAALVRAAKGSGFCRAAPRLLRAGRFPDSARALGPGARQQSLAGGQAAGCVPCVLLRPPGRLRDVQAPAARPCNRPVPGMGYEVQERGIVHGQCTSVKA